MDRHRAKQRRPGGTAAWLSGRFLTDERAPGDLDGGYGVETADYQASRLDPLRQQFVAVVASNQVKRLLNMNVGVWSTFW